MARPAENQKLMSQKKVLSYEGLGSSRLEQAAHAARQMKENEQPGLHDANLQSVARLHKPADLGIRHPQGQLVVGALDDDAPISMAEPFQVEAIGHMVWWGFSAPQHLQGLVQGDVEDSYSSRGRQITDGSELIRAK